MVVTASNRLVALSAWIFADTFVSYQGALKVAASPGGRSLGACDPLEAVGDRIALDKEPPFLRRVLAHLRHQGLAAISVGEPRDVSRRCGLTRPPINGQLTSSPIP